MSGINWVKEYVDGMRLRRSTQYTLASNAYPDNVRTSTIMAPPVTLPSQQLGSNGPQVPRIGVGLMNLSLFNEQQAEEEKLAIYDGAWSKGEVLWDTGRSYSVSNRLNSLLTDGSSGRVRRLGGPARQMVRREPGQTRHHLSVYQIWHARTHREPGWCGQHQRRQLP